MTSSANASLGAERKEVLSKSQIGEEKGSWRKNIKIRKEVKEEDIGEKEKEEEKMDENQKGDERETPSVEWQHQG